MFNGGAGAGSGATGAAGPAAAFFMGFGATMSLAVAGFNANAALEDVNAFLKEAPGTEAGDVVIGALATLVGAGPDAYKKHNPPDASEWMTPDKDDQGRPLPMPATPAADMAAMTQAAGDIPTSNPPPAPPGPLGFGP